MPRSGIAVPSYPAHRALPPPVRWIAAVILGAAWAWPGEAGACACCAYEGQWSVSEAVVTEDRTWFYDDLGTLQLSGTVSTAVYGKGAELLNGTNAVQASFASPAWRFRIALPGRTDSVATLTLRVGDHCEEFKSDVGRRDAHGEVELYKEWRFTGPLDSDNPLFPVASDNATLVLQGYGNNCVDAGDFEHFVLHFTLVRAAISDKPALREQFAAYGTVAKKE